MTNWHAKKCVETFNDKHKMFHLVNVGVPHLGEEAEGWRGVWVVNWKLDVSLGEQTEAVG